MKIGIIISSNEPETVWNAFRFANMALKDENTVKIFLIGQGVEAETLDMAKFRINAQIETFIMHKGKLYICGTCLQLRNKTGSGVCKLATLEDMYDIVAESDKVLTF